MAFAAGLNAGLGLGRNFAMKNQNEIREQELNQTQQANQQKGVLDNYNKVKKVVSDLKMNLDAGNVPEGAFDETIAPLVNETIKKMTRLHQMGASSIPPNVVEQEFNAILTAPTQQQTQQNELQQTTAIETAKQQVKSQFKNNTTAQLISGDTSLGQSLNIAPGTRERVEFPVINGKVVLDPSRANVLTRTAGPSTQVSVNTAEESPLMESLSGIAGGQVESMANNALLAEENIRMGAEMANLVIQPNFKSGAGQATIDSMKSLARTFGLDFEEQLQQAGISTGDLDTQQKFQTFSTNLIINGFDKFKGNLNQKEVDLAMDAFANLGKTKDANIDAISSLLASALISVERRDKLAQAATLPPEQREAAANKVLSEKNGNDVGQYLKRKETIKLKMENGIGPFDEPVAQKDGQSIYLNNAGQYVTITE